MVNDADCANHCMGANAGPSASNMSAAKPTHLLRRKRRFRVVDPLVVAGISDPAHEHLRPRFHTGLQPNGRDELSGQAFRPVHPHATIVAWVAANV